MNNPIDKLLKNKLEGLAIDPSPEAWSKVAASLPKKNKIWLRVAASLLMAGLGFVFWLYVNNNTGTQQIAPIAGMQTTEEVTGNTRTDIEKTPIAETEQQSQNTKATAPTPLIAKTQPVARIKEKEERTDNASAAQNEPDVLKAELTHSIALVDLDINKETPEITTAQVESKPIVIVYELAEVNIKTEDDEALIPLLPKKTGLKKVLDVANEMRTGESPLNGLRQVKDEILAFNFRKEDKNSNK